MEVLLGRSSNPESFEVLLGMSTFMTPPESKQWSNTNRVRMFGEPQRISFCKFFGLYQFPVTTVHITSLVELLIYPMMCIQMYLVML